MRLLWIATKPPLPPIDGGRLVAASTLAALAEQGVEIDLVAAIPGPRRPTPELDEVATELAAFCRPHLIPVSIHSKVRDLLRSVGSRRPFSIVRHQHEAVRRRVAALLDAGRYDAVHVEQVQALAQAEPALRLGVPVVLRAQNVESDLWRWRGPGPTLPLVGGRWMGLEAARLAAFEGWAVRRVAETVTLSARDAVRLRELAGGAARVVAVPPPFPATLPPGAHRLPGEPPLVLMGSGGWPPNRDANHWFLSTAWGEVRGRVPSAVLHLFTPAAERPPLSAGVIAHDPPSDSADAFPPGGVLVVPLRVGSGVRMKILEAWARGVCVVATPEAVAGLEAHDGRELLVAHDAAGFAAAIRRLADDPELRAGLIDAGRHALIAHHEPADVARRLIELYESVAR